MFSRVFRHTPITDDETNYLALSLIDRGLADTRALAISKAVIDNNWDRATSGILNCDSSNFPLLYRIEPRLIYMAYDKTKSNALKERIEQEQQRIRGVN